MMRVVSYCEEYLEECLGSGSRAAEREPYFGSYEVTDMRSEIVCYWIRPKSTFLRIDGKRAEFSCENSRGR